MAGAIMVKHFKHSSCFHMRFNINKLPLLASGACAHNADVAHIEGPLVQVVVVVHRRLGYVRSLLLV